MKNSLIQVLVFIASIAITYSQSIDLTIKISDKNFGKIESADYLGIIEFENDIEKSNYSTIESSIVIGDTRQNVTLKNIDVFTTSFKSNTTNQNLNSTRYFHSNLKSDVGLFLAVSSEGIKGELIYDGQRLSISTVSKSLGSTKILLSSIALSDLHCRESNGPILSNTRALRVMDKNLKQNGGAIDTIGIYVECDYYTYQSLGSSSTQVNTFISNLFAPVIAEYDKHGICLKISDISIWQTNNDPYSAIFSNPNLSAGEKRNLVYETFKCQNPTYNGRIAHFISTEPTNFGGLADTPFTGSSNSSTLYAVSNAIYTSAWPLVAHEVGHNLSSPHTHACFWNGNNTAIDGCAPTEGSCPNPGVANPGTIMSYCSNSVTFNSQVVTQMQNFVNNDLIALDFSCPYPNPTELTITELSSTSIRVTYTGSNANFLFLQYRELNSTDNWTCICNSPGLSIDITGLQANTAYEIASSIYCSSVFSPWNFCDLKIYNPNSTCSDGQQNGNETGVDCGGPDCAACPTCSDGIQNQGEVAVDCGGPCDACITGCDTDVNAYNYVADADIDETCETCSDGLQNGYETDVDCGGSYPGCPACPTCTDNIQNQGEVAIDCGGPCDACVYGCSSDVNAHNYVANPDIEETCQTCSDNILNGDEVAIDCGGSKCTPCITGCMEVFASNYEPNADIAGSCTYDCTDSFNTIASNPVANDTIITSAATLSTSGTIDVNYPNPLLWRATNAVEINANTTIDSELTIDVGPCDNN